MPDMFIFAVAIIIGALIPPEIWLFIIEVSANFIKSVKQKICSLFSN